MKCRSVARVINEEEACKYRKLYYLRKGYIESDDFSELVGSTRRKWRKDYRKAVEKGTYTDGDYDREIERINERLGWLTQKNEKREIKNNGLGTEYARHLPYGRDIPDTLAGRQ